MSDQATADSHLWILVFSLFIMLLAVTTYACCYGCFAFIARYCRQGRYCCYIDWRAYRDERDSLHRLRALRGRRNRLYHHRQQQQQQHPHYYMGFLLVPTPEDPNTSIQERLTTVQRKRILERVLHWKHFDDDENDEEESNAKNEGTKVVVDDIESQSDDQLQSDAIRIDEIADNEQNESNDGDKDQQQEDSNDDGEDWFDTDDGEAAPNSSVAFPHHEEPADSCCAICLDDFIAGEVVNGTSTNDDVSVHTDNDCQHVFHRECLLDWLNRHSVCPCCRRSMVTEADWKRGMEAEGIQAPQRFEVQITHTPGSLTPQQVAMINMSGQSAV